MMDLEVHNNQATDLTDPDLDVSRLRNVSAIGAWSVSSHKHGGGFGVESLRDGNLETYWQSDGKQMLIDAVEEPSGWTTLDLRDELTGNPLHAHLIQIAVMANHQNGKDTHMR
ncbi:Anaphase-promoting complex subunit 10 [Entophlyctis luteolus]|nr:Anaphase-promoting complex subunit 10 [Entophlyctis luteolus]